MWHAREYVTCHIREIGVLWVHFLLLSLPVCDIRYPNCPSNLLWVRVVIMKIRINNHTVLLWFRRWIQKEPCGGEYACCMIGFSRCHLSPFRGFTLSSSWLDQWYESKEDSVDPDAIAERKRLSLSTLSGSMTGTCLCFAQHSFSRYFTDTCCYRVI